MYRNKSVYQELEYWKSLPVEEKTIRATSASHSIDSSSAFLNKPRRLLEKVTCRAVVLSIFLICILSLAIGDDLIYLEDASKDRANYYMY
jgi:hypothetical protein